MWQKTSRPASGVTSSSRSARQLGMRRGRQQQLQCISAKDVTVLFKIHKKINYGETHKLVGNHPVLGNWNAESAPAMSWTDGDIWQYEAKLPANHTLEFKVIRNSQEVEWEGGNNRKLKLPESDRVEVVLKWGKTDKTAAQAPGQAAPEQQQQQPSHSNSNGTGNGKKPAEQPAQLTASDLATLDAASQGGVNGERLATAEWQGRDVKFMRSNEHSGERRGKWDTTGLEGPLKSIVEGDERAPSWLKKLEVAKTVLVDQGDWGKPTEAAAIATFVYLQWISTGAIECAEGGGHYRPNHHAELAKKIFRSLEQAGGSQDAASSMVMVLRKLHTKIPSFGEAFTATVPLTRIRDIAHRNDIPHELKQEIKHTLQNKLHRNAGPEDLIATEQMLDKVTRQPGQYNEDFIKEFKVFYAELREFFNASGLAELLVAMKSSMDSDGIAAIDHFFSEKGKLDGKGANADMNDYIGMLHAVTSVRALICAGLASGLRNDASDASMVMRQRWRLAEVKCEEYAFVLLSRAINWLEAKGGANHLNGCADPHWALPIGGMVLGLRNVGLSGWEVQECIAMEQELAAWQKAGTFQQRETALRLKATLDRVNRMGERYSSTVVGMLEPTAKALGKALGVADHAVRVFAEAEIRASIMLQLSKMCNVLVKAARLVGGVGPWDTIVPGTVAGKLVRVPRLDAEALRGVTEDTILLVDAVDGDEEVAVLGEKLKGVILCQELPHLSHLGVRARQDNVMFTTCDDKTFVEETILPLVGVKIIVATSDMGVSLTPQSRMVDFPGGVRSEVLAVPSGNGVVFKASALAASAKASEPVKAGDIRKALVERIVTMEYVMANTGGAKTMGCYKLNQVAQSPEGKELGMTTPGGVVIPFGVMDVCLANAGKTKDFEKLLDVIETAASDSREFEDAASQLRELVSSLRPSAKLLEEVKQELAKTMKRRDARVMVRSSSNVEDLSGLSGAGLYDSIPDIDYTNPEELGPAIAAVWASLYTRRAITSRRAAKVEQRSASMAVLIQELMMPELSFVLHTTSPIDRNPEIVYCEVAVGHGETLASGTRGTPWRWLVDKKSFGTVSLAFANISEAMVPRGMADGAIRVGAGGAATLTAPGTLRKVAVDYSNQELTLSVDKRKALGKRLGQLGKLLEERFEGPQDVEGCIANGNLVVVQTRPQP